MWKTKLALACVLAAGCKNASVDEPAKKDDPAATEPSGTTAGRTGKVELGPRRRTTDQPALADDKVAEHQEQMEERRRARIAQFDTDGDGKISDEERKLARHKRAEDMRKQADADGDGKVTPDEIAKSNFRRLDPESIDTDKNGDISAEEIEAALVARNRAWGGARLRPDGRFGPSFKGGRIDKIGGAAPGSAAPQP